MDGFVLCDGLRENLVISSYVTVYSVLRVPNSKILFLFVSLYIKYRWGGERLYRVLLRLAVLSGKSSGY